MHFLYIHWRIGGGGGLVVGWGGDMPDPLVPTPVPPCARGELGPPVSGAAGWHAEAGHPRS